MLATACSIFLVVIGYKNSSVGYMYYHRLKILNKQVSDIFHASITHLSSVILSKVTNLSSVIVSKVN